MERNELRILDNVNVEEEMEATSLTTSTLHFIINITKKENGEDRRDTKRLYRQTTKFINNMDYKTAKYAYLHNMFRQRFVGALLDKGARIPREIDSNLYYY